MSDQNANWQPQLSILDETRIQDLFNAAVEILENVGVNIHHPQAQKLLDQAAVPSENQLRFSIPREVIKQALKTAAKKITIHSQSGDPVMPLDPWRIYFGTGSDLIYTLNSKKDQQQISRLRDIERSAQLCQALDEIDFIMSFGLPADVPNPDAEPQQYHAIIRRATKPVIMTSFSGMEALERVHEMAVKVAGGDDTFQKKPNYILYGQFVSPLEHDYQALERLLFCAENHIPIIYVPTIMSGASGPITFFGSLALALAETLAGLVIHQLSNPGAPFITGACISPLDMKSGLFPYGSAEWRLNDLAFAELSRHFGIPVFGTGGASDSKRLDAQAGAEYSSSLLTAALAGTNLIHDVGYLNSGLTGSLESIVLGADIIRWVKRFISGIQISENQLAMDVIMETGPAGEFLSHDHTYKNLHQTVWEPLVFNHQDHDSWREAGSKTYERNALDFALEILNSTEKHQLDPNVNQELAEISKYDSKI